MPLNLKSKSDEQGKKYCNTLAVSNKFIYMIALTNEVQTMLSFLKTNKYDIVMCLNLLGKQCSEH